MFAIDFDLFTRQLFAQGASQRLYILNPTTGAATQVGTGMFNPPLMGGEFGMAFNPAMGELRIVTNFGQNVRIDPDAGAIAGVDTPLAYLPGDPLAEEDPNAAALAYTSNGMAFVIDSLARTLARSDSLSTGERVTGPTHVYGTLFPGPGPALVTSATTKSRRCPDIPIARYRCFTCERC